MWFAARRVYAIVVRMIVLREMAAAKVNLYLHVTGKRSDGYHDLDSWVVFADVADSLQAVKADTTSLTIEGAFAHLVPDGNNSVLSAVKALQKRYGVQEGVQLTLTKKLPVAAGIGGGSADAAAALRLLARVWNLQPDAGELDAMARALGADVPACLRSHSLYMNGIGEKIERAPDVALDAVLVNPGKALPTKDVFAGLEGRCSSAMRHPPEFASTQAVAGFLRQARNELEAPAIALVPLIGDVLAALDVQKGCLLSRMSGSGATCFGIYESRENALDAAQLLQKAYPEWWVQHTKLR